MPPDKVLLKFLLLIWVHVMMVASLTDSFLLSLVLQLLLGNAKVFPGHGGYIIPPACSGSALGFFPNRTCLKYLYRHKSTRHPEPPHLSLLNTKEQWFNLELPLDV